MTYLVGAAVFVLVSGGVHGGRGGRETEGGREHERASAQRARVRREGGSSRGDGAKSGQESGTESECGREQGRERAERDCGRERLQGSGRSG
jgi:hypothetical protein